MKILVEIPEICPECGFTNFKFYGNVRYGKPFTEVKCERCGKTVTPTSAEA